MKFSVPTALALLGAILAPSHAITTIPYDSTLTLGNVVQKEHIDGLKDVAALQTRVDLLDDSYNAKLQSKLSLDMSIQELRSVLKGDAGEPENLKALRDKRNELEQDLVNSLTEVVTAREEYQDKYVAYMNLRASPEAQTKIGSAPESPLDFGQSPMIPYEMSSDSMKMNVQFFQVAENDQDSTAHVQKVKSFVAGAIADVFGVSEVGTTATAGAEAHMNAQRQTNTLVGTLVIACTATHKIGKKIEPTVYDADKLIRAWNEVHPDERIDVYGDINVQKMATEIYSPSSSSGDEKEKTLSMLTGVTYGSSFIGFVHLTKNSETKSFQSMRSTAESVSTEIKTRAWFETITGGFGFSGSAAEDLKSLVSTSELSSHVGLITVGIIPSIASQKVETALKQFTEFDPKSIDGALATMASNTASTDMDVETAARQNTRAGQVNGVQAAKYEGIISAVGEFDKQTNQILDTNSLMIAFDDYVKVTRDTQSGAPVNFFVTDMNKKEIMIQWLQEYRPEVYAYIVRGQDPTTIEELWAKAS